MGEQAEPALFILFALAGPQEQEAGDQQEQDPAVARPLTDHAADDAAHEEAGDRHPGLEDREDERDPQLIATFEAGHAEGGRQGEGVQGEREEEPGRDQELPHRPGA